MKATDLVTIAPRIVAGADVLIGVLNTLLERRQVRPVLPVLVPEVVCIKAGKEKGRGDDAGWARLLVRGLLCQVVCFFWLFRLCSFRFPKVP